MGFLTYQTRKILITQMKEDLNMRLMIMSARINRMTAESTELAQERARIQTSQMNSLIDPETGEITLDKYQQVLNSTADIDVRIQLLDIKEEEMDSEIQSMNSQLQQLNAEEDQIDKAMDNSIKKTFGALAKG